MVRFALLFLLFVITSVSHAAEPCITIRGRAHLYGGDGQLRIWHVGTHHDYQPDEPSRRLVEDWLRAGTSASDRSLYAGQPSTVYLFADFLVCPVEAYKDGSVQLSRVVRADHRHYVPAR